MERDPETPEATRSLLDWFFDTYTQEKAIEAGTPHDELDLLAREVLHWGAKYHVLISDAERNVAERLGVDVAHLGRRVVTAATFHRLGF
ncbi:hypothetical protein D3C87_1662570 [compost metagenome]